MVPIVLPSLIPPQIEPMTHFETENRRMSMMAGMINRLR